MKKLLAVAACTAVLVALSPAPAAHAAPSIYPTYSNGAYLSFRGMIDDCLEADLFLTTIDTTIVGLDGIIHASDHGEGALEIDDTCNLTPPECDEDCEDAEPRPTPVLRAGLQPSHGSEVRVTTLATAKYRENMKVSSADLKRIRFSIDWKATAPQVQTFEREQTDAGLFLRAGASRKAKATFTIVAGDYTITGSTKKASIWQSAYTQL